MLRWPVEQSVFASTVKFERGKHFASCGQAKVALFDRSAEEPRTEIIHALSVHRESDIARLHYVSEIPPPPTPWIAHRYTLLGNRPAAPCGTTSGQPPSTIWALASYRKRFVPPANFTPLRRPASKGWA